MLGRALRDVHAQVPRGVWRGRSILLAGNVTPSSNLREGTAYLRADCLLVWLATFPNVCALSLSGIRQEGLPLTHQSNPARRIYFSVRGQGSPQLVPVFVQANEPTSRGGNGEKSLGRNREQLAAKAMLECLPFTRQVLGPPNRTTEARCTELVTFEDVFAEDPQ